ncbi:MAG TPA: amidohydrolase family protein [Acetobacteraceae bacterium]|nr:amidohydrolase family protein [Acetobacteraceae bacterium]
MSEGLLERTRESEARLGIVDCDIHPMLRSEKALLPYLSARWREELETCGLRTRNPFVASYAVPKATPALSRRDSWPPSGGPPGSDLDFMRAQHLDPYGIETGILQVLIPSGKDQRNPGFGAALSAALNDWQVAEWTEPEPRLKASVIIPAEDAEASVAEIERCAGRRDFASIFISARTTEPLGRKRYWPIFAAAVRHNLPLGIHTGGSNGIAKTPAGWPSYYFEDHMADAFAMQPLLASLVLEGVFEEFPELKVVMIEGGFGWAPSLGWRLDQHWARMRKEVPHVKQPPSRYIRRQVWFATQPVEEPAERRDLRTLIDWIGWDRMVFASDYPHWDMDDPRLAFKVALDERETRAVFRDNARTAYGLA